MHTKRYLPVAISLSIAFASGILPASAQAGQFAGAFAAQRDAMIQEQKAADEAKAAEAAAAAANNPDNAGDKKAQADSSDSAKTTESKTDTKPADATTSGDDKKTDAAAGTEKKDDTASTSTDKKDDPLAVDGEKKADGDDAKTDEEKDKEKEDEKKASEDEQKKMDDAEKAAKAAGYTPVKAALFDINNGHPEDAIAKLSPVVAKNAKDVQAHYVLATAYVLSRKYDQAAEQYRAVLKLVPADSKIAARATEGLRKIQH